MSFKDSFAKGAGVGFGTIGCLAYAGYALCGLLLWGTATVWYGKTYADPTVQSYRWNFSPIFSYSR